MNYNKKYLITYEGVRKLEAELEYLKTVRRNEIKEKIKVALTFGDLSENSEYDEVKTEQAFLEGRILQLESMLKNASVVDDVDVPNDSVSIGSVVELEDYELGENVEYHIVGSIEADPINYKISNESPVGSALIGKKKGDIIKVTAPSGINEFKILSVKRA
ncbi:MAG: transcription elongation factor GreA [Oscillospiraceae bacterium]|nr:transcription elongation factor GreA [Oscillospiraceae bacterium]